MEYIYTSLSKIGLKRLNNEDALGVFDVEGGLLAVVCDGLGGNKAGDVASQTTTGIILQSFQELSGKNYLERIKLSVQRANTFLLEKSAGDVNLKGMATTVELLYLKENTVYWGHVGDSRIYHYKNGKLNQLTKDHSLVQKLVDEGYLTLKEAENHPNRNIIVRALGDTETIEVDVSKLKINQKDENIFFICTDGVSSVLNDSEMEEIFKLKDHNLVKIKITELIEDRGAPDNFSFVIISLSN